MQKQIEFTVKYRNKTYTFDFGSEVYIFHTGIYNEIDKKYGLKALMKYVSLVFDAYLSDDNRTPLGPLADYVAAKWRKSKI